MSAAKTDREEATRGAVLAEFVITIVPVLMMTFGWMQLAWLYTANLLVQHSATACVRAAAVVDDKPFNPGDNGSVSDIQLAAERAAEVQSAKIFDGLTCSVANEATEEDPFGRVRATVTADFACRVPMGRFIICGAGSKKQLTKTAEMPFQGARYKEK